MQLLVVSQGFVQAASGTTVKFKRKGWDFTMECVIRWFHEDENFRQAAAAAHPLDFTDVDGMAGSMYMNLLDKDCMHRLSNRKDAFGAGVYGVGAAACMKCTRPSSTGSA